MIVEKIKQNLQGGFKFSIQRSYVINQVNDLFILEFMIPNKTSVARNSSAVSVRDGIHIWSPSKKFVDNDQTQKVW